MARREMGHVTLELYIEYLELKQEVKKQVEIVNDFEYAERYDDEKSPAHKEHQETLDKKVERLSFVLYLLEHEHGVSMRNLILLSLNVDVSVYEENRGDTS